MEVWAGIRTTPGAAKAIGISAAGFYHLETRAVNAVIAACEPRARGPAPGARAVQDVDRLTRENQRLAHDLARLQALVRSTQRLAGVPPARPPPPIVTKGGKARKGRRPAVRALALVRTLKRGGEAAAAAAAASAAAAAAGGEGSGGAGAAGEAAPTPPPAAGPSTSPVPAATAGTSQGGG